MTLKLYLYIKYPWALWNSVFVLWLCKPTKTSLSTVISQLHGSVSEEGMANPRTFTVIADKEWNRQGYMEFLICHQLFSPAVRDVLRKTGSTSFPSFVRKWALRESYRFWGGCLQQIHKQLLQASNWAKHLIDEKEYKIAPLRGALCIYLVLICLPFALEQVIVSEVLKGAEAWLKHHAN